VQGRNISIDYRWADGDWDRLGTYAAELVRMAPDVLFAAATPALAALHQQTRSLPIVFVQVSDPVKLGLVASLARPGGKITGFTNFEGIVTLIGNLQTKGPWPKRFTLRLSLGATLA
jgi:putative tryptophan/tyrosine transport system substrate-binding protein